MAKRGGGERKQALLEAARDLIFGEGTARFTIRRLAERVGVTEAAIYRHFPSKERLLLELLEHLFTDWDAGLTAIVNAPEPAVERIQRLAAFHLDHLLTAHFNPVLLLSDASDPAQAKLHAALVRIAGALTGAIQRVIETGVNTREFRTDLDLEAAVSAIIGAIQGTVLRWTLSRRTAGLRERLARTLAFILTAATPPGETPGLLRDHSGRRTGSRTPPTSRARSPRRTRRSRAPGFAAAAATRADPLRPDDRPRGWGRARLASLHAHRTD